MNPATAPAEPASEILAPLDSVLWTEELNRMPARPPDYERENCALSARQVIGHSEDRFRFMAEFMPQKIFLAKPDGSIDYFNQQWIDYTGLSSETMRKSGWDQFIHADDVEEHMRLWKHSLETGEPFNFREIPFIFVTAHDDGPVRQRAIAAGALDVLHKPFAASALLATVAIAITRRNSA